MQLRWCLILLQSFSTGKPVHHFSSKLTEQHRNCQMLEDCYINHKFEGTEQSDFPDVNKHLMEVLFKPIPRSYDPFFDERHFFKRTSNFNSRLHSSREHDSDITINRKMTPIHLPPFFVKFGR